MRHLLIGLIAGSVLFTTGMAPTREACGDEPAYVPKPTLPYYMRRDPSPRTRVLDTLYNGRSRRSPVEQQLLRQNYDVAGKLPILPAKRDVRVRDAADNVLPSVKPIRNYSTPLLGTQRTTRDPLVRNRLSATERTEQQLYRGPSRPGMIAPRAQQERTAPSGRELGRRNN
ncbi:hypothetical protein [Bremerella cremea]|uniref:hypothetical protein n=1 Tax=Bremerella cremea TaxID=1031537 RepID=UPI0031ED3775